MYCYVKDCIFQTIGTLKSIGIEISVCDTHYDEAESMLYQYEVDVQLLAQQIKKSLRIIGHKRSTEPCIASTGGGQDD